MKQETNQPVPNQLEVVHALPGRVRLRVLGDDFQQQLPAIAQHLRECEGVESVQIRETTGSILVIFEPNTLSTSQLREYLFPVSHSSTSVTSEAGTYQSSGEKIFSQLFSLIPVLLAWLVVKRFNLTGWKAIATYLLVAGLIGEIIEHVWLELFPSPTNDSSETTAEPKKLPPLNEERDFDCQVVHHIPGRIRLSIPKIREDKNYAQKLQLMLEQDVRITGVRIKPTIGSVVVTYMPEALGGLREGELATIFSELIGLIDSAAALETSSPLTAEAQNLVEGDGHLSEETLTDFSEDQHQKF